MPELFVTGVQARGDRDQGSRSAPFSGRERPHEGTSWSSSVILVCSGTTLPRIRSAIGWTGSRGRSGPPLWWTETTRISTSLMPFRQKCGGAPPSALSPPASTTSGAVMSTQLPEKASSSSAVERASTRTKERRERVGGRGNCRAWKRWSGVRFPRPGRVEGGLRVDPRCSSQGLFMALWRATYAMLHSQRENRRPGFQVSGRACRAANSRCGASATTTSIPALSTPAPPENSAPSIGRSDLSWSRICHNDAA